MTHTADISRVISLSAYNSVNSVNFLLVLSVLSLALPAMSCGCTPCSELLVDDKTDDPTSILHLKSPSDAISGEYQGMSSLDVFTFRTDGLKHLDSYQRFDDLDRSEVRIASGSGERKIFVCANSQWNRKEWTIVNSIEALEGFKADLEYEKRMFPLMTGETSAEDGSETSVRLKMLVSEIRIHSLRCDFSDKGYNGCTISDVRVYLINVNASCGITSEGTIMPERIINFGRLDPNDINKFEEPDLISVKLTENISSETIYPDICLRCYPNSCLEESLGSPFTKLVIEGKIKGETYYWSVAVGRQGERNEDNSYGIFRNSIYRYDIIIIGKGSKDPDICADKKSMAIKFETELWKEKDLYSITY